MVITPRMPMATWTRFLLCSVIGALYESFWSGKKHLVLMKEIDTFDHE